VNWPKDWAKLLMNCAIIAADALPRGGNVSVKASENASKPGFVISATGQGARINEEVAPLLRGEPSPALDGRSIQSYLTYRLAKLLHTQLVLNTGEGSIILAAGAMVSDRDGG